MKTFTRITTAIFLSGSFLSVVQAAPPSDVPTAVVKFGDLDINRPAGKESLYLRLNRAAQSVCSPGSWYRRALLSPQYEACMEQALSGAIAKINRPDFTDYVALRTQKPAVVDARLAAR